MLREAHASDSSIQQSNVGTVTFFSSSLAVNPAHDEKVNKSTRINQQGTGTLSTSVWCLIDAIWNHLVKSVKQRAECSSVWAERGRGRAQHCVQGACMPNAHTGKSSMHWRQFDNRVKKNKKQKKTSETQHAEPTKTACRAHFQMQVLHYVTLWHRLTRESDIITTFIGQKRWKGITALL